MKATVVASLLLFVAVGLVNLAEATSYAPPPAPALKYTEAVELASRFAAKNKSDLADYYIDRVWRGSIPNEDKDCWLVSWASPTKGWYFVAVYMDKTVKLPPSGGVFSKNPFMSWSFVPPAETPAAEPGAGQPATKPADKVPAKVQPPPPTSKNAPR